MKNSNISLFKGYSDTESVETSLEEVVSTIRSNAALKDRTEKYRYYQEENLPKDANREKAGCLCFAVAVRFSGGKTRNDIVAWTGLTLVDLDHIEPERMEDIWKQICADEHTLLAYTTISGQGIRIICRIGELNGMTLDRTFRCYTRYFNLVNEYYSNLTHHRSDGQCKNATRLSGLAADPDAYFNPDATGFELIPVPVTPPVPGADAAEAEPVLTNKRLKRAVKTAEQELAKAGIAYCVHHHNEYVMRMGYLLNQFGVGYRTAVQWATERFADYDGDVASVITSCYANRQEHGIRSFCRKKKEREKGEGRFASVEEIETFLSSQAKFRKNVVSGKCEVLMGEQDAEYTELTDRCVNTLWNRMGKKELSARISDIRAVIDSEYTPLFNPFEEYFAKLPAWDGVTDYIGELAATVHVKKDAHLFAPLFKKWFVAMIASLLNPKVVNHEILVLIGKQGIYKTTWMQRLLPEELQRYFYVKSNSRRLSKDDLFTLTEFALVCLEELEEMNETLVSQMKAMTGMETVNERAAYGHFKESRPHIASFCGTSNNVTFLNDPSGNRRWLPFEVESIDSPFDHPVNYAGVYAQGYALWKNAFRYWLNQEEIAVVNLHNQAFEVPCLERELVQVYFHRPQSGEVGEFLTNAQILSRINTGIRQLLNPTRLGLVMKEEGYRHDRFNGKKGYWVVKNKES